MRLFDVNFQKNISRYLLQALLAGLAVGLALELFDVVHDPILVAAFGASGFIAFGMPHSTMAASRNLIGGYAVGAFVGSVFYFLTMAPFEHHGVLQFVHIAACVLAVTITMILMTVTETEHAPGVSIALGLVINGWTPFIVVKVMAGIVIISLMKRLFKKKIINLV